MNSGLYAACAGLVARMQALDTIASNVANASTAGYRGDKDSFGTVLAQAANHGPLSRLNTATNSYSHLAGTSLDETQGSITRTGNPLDVAIQGSGYFKVQTATGIAYTRNGSFQLDPTGRLTTSTGDPVMGETGPITIGRGQVSISAQGVISSDGAVVGKLSVVGFGPGVQMSHRGSSYYNAPAGAKEEAAPDSSVQQGSLESSNVSPVEGVVQLISAQRSAESMRHVLTMLDSEMDKTAVQDLSRVV